MGADPLEPSQLLDAFETYLRRQLGSEGPEVVQVRLGESLRRAPANAGIVVAAGPRSPAAERIFALRSGMRPQWRGTACWAPSERGVEFTVWDRWRLDRVGSPPPQFDVLAVVSTYNEADVIEAVLERILAGGARAHVIDNWSTDGTEKLVEGFLSGGRVTMERFPTEGPQPYFQLEALLRRLGEVAATSGADWVIHHDADEIHESPWRGVTLRQGLWAVGQWGFNCVDHTGYEFRPVDDSWRPGGDPGTAFDWFEFGPFPGHFLLLKAWQPAAGKVSNAESGGHSAEFEGRRIFPYKFPIRHYPLRSPEHARRKLFTERRPRFDPKERERGWHAHYDEFGDDSDFLWDPSGLHRWSTLDGRILLQRISGIGLPNNPWPGEGPPVDAV